MSKMNFLDKARKKVEDTINEVSATATQLVQGRIVYPPVGGYNHTAYQQPPAGYYHAAPHGQYPGQPPPQQWQQPQQHLYGTQPMQPHHQNQYHSTAPVYPQPYHAPPPVASPALQPSYVVSPQQQHYVPVQGGPGQSYTPSPVTSPIPLHAGPAPVNQPQYFSPVPGHPGQRYTPSPIQNQQYQTPPPIRSQQPHPSQEPPPAYTPPVNNMVGMSKPVAPNLPARRDSRAQSNVSQANVPQMNFQQPTIQSPTIQQQNFQSPNMQQPNLYQPNVQQSNIQHPNPQHPNTPHPNPPHANPPQPNVQYTGFQQPTAHQPSSQHPGGQHPNPQPATPHQPSGPSPSPQIPNLHQAHTLHKVQQPSVHLPNSRHPSPQNHGFQQPNSQQHSPHQASAQTSHVQQQGAQQPSARQPSPQSNGPQKPSSQQPSPHQTSAQILNAQQPVVQQPNNQQHIAQSPAPQQPNSQQYIPYQASTQPSNTQQTSVQQHLAQQPSVQPPKGLHYSHSQLPYPAAFELASPEPSNLPQELASTEVQHPSLLAPSNPEMPRPLSLPNRQRQSVSIPTPPVAIPAPLTKLPCLATEGARTKSTKFHIPKTGEDFSACDNCYRMFLAPYADLVVCFEEYKGPETVFVCDMSFGRVQQIVLTQCVPHGTLDPIRDFVKILTTLTPCTGAVISSPGPMWITRGAAIPDLAVCTTCFELYFRLTPFAVHFETKIHPETRDWSCDISVPYFKSLLRSELSKSPISFANFAKEANSKFKQPPCTGPGKSIAICTEVNRYLIFSAKEGAGGVCISCFSEKLEFTSLEKDWELSELADEDIGKSTCDLAGEYSKTAMTVAIKRGATDIWRKVVVLDVQLPPCPSLKGVDEEDLAKEVQMKGDIAQWYQITESPSVIACPRCYWLFVQLFGAAHLCSPMTAPLVPGVIRQCSWTHSNTPDDADIATADNFEDSSAWRGRRLRAALTSGYDTGDWTEVQEVAASLAKEPPPCAGRDRGLKRSSGRKWFGRIRADKTNDDDCTIVMCEECFVRTAKGKAHEAFFNTDLTEAAHRDEGADGFICQPYTNRARSYIRAAADDGDLASFARYWNNREALALRRKQWLPILQQQNVKMALYNQQTSMQMVMKTNAMANALTLKGGAGIVEAVSGETGYRYGNSQIGTNFMTQGSADAELAWQNASNMKVGQGLNPVAETMRIQALWEIDNQAFLAVE